MCILQKINGGKDMAKSKHDCPNCGCDTRPIKFRILSTIFNAYFCHQECYKNYRNKIEAKKNLENEAVNKALEGIKAIAVYHNTEDYPDLFVAREFHSIKNGIAKGSVLGTGNTLHAVRKFIPKGMVKTARSPDDEPQIVETWI